MHLGPGPGHGTYFRNPLRKNSLDMSYSVCRRVADLLTTAFWQNGLVPEGCHSFCALKDLRFRGCG